MQAPFVQVWLELQQAVPHTVPGQSPTQLLFRQNWLGLQAFPQLPQLAASDATQSPQSSVPDGHLHAPPWQVRPAPQGMPHEPQLFESDEVSTHWPLQACWGAVHVMPVPPAPAVPPLVPPLPGLPPVPGEQAAARIARPRPPTSA